MNETLDEDSTLFGIYQAEPNGFIKSIKISDKDKYSYVTDRSNYMLGYFTLISHDEGSYIKLLKDFSNWLKTFPNQEIINLVTPFANSISAKYRNKIWKKNM
ncbi:MAG: hypothetical protein IPO39_05785 [Bacteroidetes bacterium]|nr:hypothetical protein [Bacteroidota bacterium]